MQIGMIGLGRMGGAMVEKICVADIHVVGFDADAKSVDSLANVAGFDGAYSLDSMLNAMPAPRIIWLMLPAGKATHNILEELRFKLTAGDLIVNGANQLYKTSIVEAETFRECGVSLIDAGIAGGVHGAAHGYCIMLGGEAVAVKRIERVLNGLAPDANQWLHCGPSGAGHYAKMVHNGIEYGLMQAYAEGFSLLSAKREFDLDIAAIAENWRHGSVVRSWLLDLTADFLKRDRALDGVAPVVPDSGEGRWAAQEAIELGVPAPVLSSALISRFVSQGEDEYSAKLLAMMRKGFGGHAVMVEKNEGKAD
jgi:6-phosphogluconate dehydrogenase